MRVSGEWIVVVIMFILCAFFYALISMTADPRSTPFPTLMLVLMSAIGATKIIAQLQERTEKRGKGEKFPFLRVSFIIITIAAYIIAMDYLGFYASSFLFFVLTTLAIQNFPRTPKVIAVRAGIGFTVCLSLYLLFTVLLKVQIPKGIFI